jgi:aspartyl-tRNA synthetase
MFYAVLYLAHFQHLTQVHSLLRYVELRRWGSVPHAGFGLGFDRLVLLLTGLTNVRCVIAYSYPKCLLFMTFMIRSPGSALRSACICISADDSSFLPSETLLLFRVTREAT